MSQKVGPQRRGQEPLAVGSREDASQKTSPHGQAFPCAAAGTQEEPLSAPPTLDGTAWGPALLLCWVGRQVLPGNSSRGCSSTGGCDLICGALGVAPEMGARQVPTKSFPVAIARGWAPAVGQDGGPVSGGLGADLFLSEHLICRDSAPSVRLSWAW